MGSLNTGFDELISKIRQGREVGHASFEPVFYLIFPPTQILDVKRTLPAWIARLRNEGWSVHLFSIATEITAIFQNAPLRRIWLAADSQAPMAWDKTNQSLANALIHGKDTLYSRLKSCLDGIQNPSQSILLVTDMEALHPYLLIGTIESQLYGSFKSPTIFLYPGERTGKTRLKFLGFYPEDGNYRSVHVDV